MSIIYHFLFLLQWRRHLIGLGRTHTHTKRFCKFSGKNILDARYRERFVLQCHHWPNQLTDCNWRKFSSLVAIAFNGNLILIWQNLQVERAKNISVRSKRYLAFWRRTTLDNSRLSKTNCLIPSILDAPDCRFKCAETETACWHFHFVVLRWKSETNLSVSYTRFLSKSKTENQYPNPMHTHSHCIEILEVSEYVNRFRAKINAKTHFSLSFRSGCLMLADSLDDYK